MPTLERHRRFFAEFVTNASGPPDPALTDAFASVAREDFLGPGPWFVAVGQGRYLESPTSDPTFLYQDFHVRIDSGRSINSGLPSLHAICLRACQPRPGDQVVHVGAGTGYYTALLAALVGPRGFVDAHEIDGTLARAAQANLRQLANVRVSTRSGTGSVGFADVIYVNAGATHPCDGWLDALKPGGRLLFPLTPRDQPGGLLLAVKVDETRFAARMVAAARFTPCLGARDDAESDVLRDALDHHPWSEVRSLRRGIAPDSTAWLIGRGWWLSSAPP